MSNYSGHQEQLCRSNTCSWRRSEFCSSSVVDFGHRWGNRHENSNANPENSNENRDAHNNNNNNNNNNHHQRPTTNNQQQPRRRTIVILVALFSRLPAKSPQKNVSKWQPGHVLICDEKYVWSPVWVWNSRDNASFAIAVSCESGTVT